MSRRWAESDITAAATAKPPTVRRQLEYDEQCALLQWAELQFIRLQIRSRSIELCLADHLVASLNGVYLYGTPAKRAAQWQRQVKAGAKKNAPDLALNIPYRGYAGMKIEMKKQRRDYPSPSALKRALRPGQAEYLNTLERIGYFTCVGYGWIDAATYICEYFEWNPRRKGLC